MSRRASQVSGGSAGSGGSRGSTGSVGRARGTAARGINASSTPKSETKPPGSELHTPASSPISGPGAAGTPGASSSTPSPSSRPPGQSPQSPETQVKQPRTKSVQFNPTPDVSKHQAPWCTQSSSMDDKNPNLSAILLESLIETSDDANDDLTQNRSSSMMWKPHDVSRLVAQEADDVRVAILLAAAAAESEQSRAPDAELPQTRRSPPSVPKSRSPQTRHAQHALGESLRHVQRELRPMPVSDNVVPIEDDKIAENLSAEDAAAMMHRLEHGYSMAAPPKQLFNFLFPDQGASFSTSPEDDADSGAGPSRSEKDKAESGQEKEEGKPKGEGDEHGYLMALPETMGILEAKSSPTEVMQAAYRAAQPSKVPPEGRIVY